METTENKSYTEICERCLEQEARYQLDSFSASDAFKLGLEACKIAYEELKRPIALHIEYDEYPLFSHFMDGTDAHNVYWVNVKKNTVKKFGHSSLYMGQECLSRGTTFAADTGLPESDYRGEGGSFPLVVRGKGRVGTITVSGLTSAEDHDLAVEALRRCFFGTRK